MLDFLVNDKRMLDLISPDQDMVDCGDYGGFVEGPIWSEKYNDLTFNSLSNKKTWRFDPDTGKSQLYDEDTNISNGMAYDLDGNIIVCEQIGFRILRTDREFKRYEVIADSYNGKPFISPNDVVVHSNGTIYFTDPHYGRRPTRHGKFSSQPQEKQRVYGIRPGRGELFVATEETNCPNGLCFSLDEKEIYFAESSTYELSAMDVNEDGTFSNRRILAVTPELGHGAPDGIKIDNEGNIWLTAQGGIQVYNRAGSFYGLFRTPEVSGNLCFGGREKDTLFFGCESHLMTVKTKVKRP